MIGFIKQWRNRRRIRRFFRELISHLDQGLKESQEYIEHVDENWELYFDDESDWVILKSDLKERYDALIAGMSQIDQMQAKYREGHNKKEQD